MCSQISLLCRIPPKKSQQQFYGDEDAFAIAFKEHFWDLQVGVVCFWAIETSLNNDELMVWMIIVIIIVMIILKIAYLENAYW